MSDVEFARKLKEDFLRRCPLGVNMELRQIPPLPDTVSNAWPHGGFVMSLTAIFNGDVVEKRETFPLKAGDDPMTVMLQAMKWGVVQIKEAIAATEVERPKKIRKIKFPKELQA